MSNHQIGTHLFLQLVVILAACRVVGWFGRHLLGQTQVFMEMVAGVLLGPSCLGVLMPSAQAWLFPKQLVVGVLENGDVIRSPHPNMTILYAIAQVGLVLYMFVIGLEFDVGLLRGRVRSAALVSLAGIVVPFAAAGAILPILLRRDDIWAGPISPGVAWLFVGASISITAFPMLARILFERGIASTPLGALTLAAGSIDDAIAWCLLALVMSLFGKAPEVALLTIGGGIVYGSLMMTGGRWLFGRLLERTRTLNGAWADPFASVVLALLACAWVTDLIGIYAVFGAFICGAAMPKQPEIRTVVSRVERLTTTLFLPVFFVYSGLNTRIGLVNSLDLWVLVVLVALVSTLGKGVACGIAARASGQGWRASGVIGVLMNARGLMELILLNVGLERGVITPTFFAVMVMMAIVTTGMASPLYALLARGVAWETQLEQTRKVFLR